MPALAGYLWLLPVGVLLGGLARMLGKVAGQSVGITRRVCPANAAPSGACASLITPGH